MAWKLLVAAAGPHMTIGRDNALPWHLPEDLKRFRQLTLGHTVLMGRRTYESIGRPLPQRRNIVLTHQPRTALAWPTEVEICSSVAEVQAMLAPDEQVFVIGGAEVYRQVLEQGLVDTLYLTRIPDAIEGDTFLPPIHWNEWQQISREEQPADHRHACAFAFEVWQKLP